MLIRLGGKPVCPRTELLEEVDAGLRTLYLQGFLSKTCCPASTSCETLRHGFSSVSSLVPKCYFAQRRMNGSASCFKTLNHASWRAPVCLQRPGRRRRSHASRKKAERGGIHAARVEQGFAGMGRQGRRRATCGRVSTSSSEAPCRVQGGELDLGKSVQNDGERRERREPRPTAPEHLRCVDYMTFGELSDVSYGAVR